VRQDNLHKNPTNEIAYKPTGERRKVAKQPHPMLILKDYQSGK
jgi:hypothetical protein